MARPSHKTGHLALYEEDGRWLHHRCPSPLPHFHGIFEWDAGDLCLLRQAKRKQLMQEGVPALTDILVDRSISKKELSLYCRRRTRGEEATICLIERLLQELRGANGRDLMGVPLLDEVRMEHIWRVQKRHVRCIQDMPGVPLYTEVGTTTKAGVTLTRYRCYRGGSRTASSTPPEGSVSRILVFPC